MVAGRGVVLGWGRLGSQRDVLGDAIRLLLRHRVGDGDELLAAEGVGWSVRHIQSHVPCVEIDVDLQIEGLDAVGTEGVIMRKRIREGKHYNIRRNKLWSRVNW